MNALVSPLPQAVVVMLTLPGAGRVLALRTRTSRCTAEYLVAHQDGSPVYITDQSDAGRAPAAYQLEEVAPMDQWLAGADRADALRILVATQPQALEPLTLVRAVHHLAQHASSPADALAHAAAVSRACAASEAHTQAEVDRLMGLPA